MEEIATMGGDDGRALITSCCSLSMAAHRSTNFLLHALPTTSVFAFPASWSAADWHLDPSSPFGDAAADPSLFPSLRTVGCATAALLNAAFLRSFHRLLTHSPFQTELNRASTLNHRIIFTGHSSGGAIASLATIWLLERNPTTQRPPLCLTFGSPLIGDAVFGHALRRENWSRRFLHFVVASDIVPRIPLSPLSPDLQAVLHFLCPKSLSFSLNSIGASHLVLLFYTTVLRGALSISSRRACSLMGCANPLLEVLAGFIDVTPYRPFGDYAFFTPGGKVLVSSNPDSVLQLLFYCLQHRVGQDISEAARRSLDNHITYDLAVKNCLEQNFTELDKIELHLPREDSLTRKNFSELDGIEYLLREDLQLGAEARLALRAAAEWERQKSNNQGKIDANYSKIEEALELLDEYRGTCEMRGVGYYDAFKLQRDPDDFQANVKRLDLAGQWDEIVEMLRRCELPDGIEGRPEWVKLATRYRVLVEPLDIANYYRHTKNEDTGPYVAKGRPKRYRYTQRWLEKAQRVAEGSSRESCFWAVVEELSGGGRAFEEVKGRVVELEEDVAAWLAAGRLGRDVLLDGTTFVKWWRTFPKQHRMESQIARFMNVAGND